MSRLLFLATALTASGLAACGPASYEPVSQRQSMRFDAELAGLVPGRPQNCLPLRSTASIVAAREGILLFREGRVVYANKTRGGCDRVADSPYTLVTDNFTGTLCGGTIARVVDLSVSGALRGTCVLGDFTPYRRPRP